MPRDLGDRQTLRDVVVGRDDDAIYEALDSIGVDAALDQVFASMKRAFSPARAKGASGVIQWDIGTPVGMRSYQIVIEDGRCVIHLGAEAPARVTLSALLADFLRIVCGERDAMQAYMQRTLTASGDVLFAKRQQEWFEKS